MQGNKTWLLSRIGFLAGEVDNVLLWRGVGLFGRATYEVQAAVTPAIQLVEVNKNSQNSNNMNHGRNGYNNNGRAEGDSFQFKKVGFFGQTEGESFRSKIEEEEYWLKVKEIGEDGSCVIL